MKSFPSSRRRSILSVTLFLLSIASTTTNASASPGPYVSVYPPSALVSLPKMDATIEVIVHNVTNCYGVDFWLTYNSTLLSKQGLVDVHGPFDSGNPPIRLDPSTCPGGYVLTDISIPGTVRVGLTFVGALGAPSFNGTGTACAITFQGNVLGVSNLTFDESKVKIWDPTGTPLPREPSVNGEIDVIPEFPAATITPVLMIATLAAALFAASKWPRKRQRMRAHIM